MDDKEFSDALESGLNGMWKEYEFKFCIYPESTFDRNVNVRTKDLSDKEKYEWHSYVFVCPFMSAELVISPCKTYVCSFR